MSYTYNVDVEVDISDILDDMDEEDIIELFEERFGKRLYGSESWNDIHHKRRTLSEKDFLTYIDKVIMDATGRIL